MGECPAGATALVAQQAATGSGLSVVAAALEPAWTVELSSAPEAAAAADASRIFVSLDDGTTVAIDRSTGSRLWSRTLGSRWPPEPTPDALFVTGRDALHELDPATGRTLRTIELPGPVSAPLAHARALVVVALESGTLRGIGRDGTPAWDVHLGAASRVAIAVGRDAVFTALEDGRLVAVAREDGRQIWARSIGGRLTPPLAAGDRVFVGSTDDTLYAFGAGSGVLAWSWPTGNDVAGMAADDDRIFVASLDNMLRALDRNSGNLAWQQVIGTRPVWPPFRRGDRIYVSGLRPPLIAFDAESGTPVESFTLPEPYAPLLLAGPLLVLPEGESPAVDVVAVARNGIVVGLRRALRDEEKKDP